MKNYGDPLSNCNDNVEDTRNIVSNDESPLPAMDTMPNTISQVNKYHY
jgi:hypothetical protein